MNKLNILWTTDNKDNVFCGNCIPSGMLRSVENRFHRFSAFHRNATKKNYKSKE